MENDPKLEGNVRKALTPWEIQSRTQTNSCRNSLRPEGTNQQEHDILEVICNEFYALDREWRFTYLNNLCTCYYESRYEDLLGKVVWDEFPMARGSSFEIECRRAMREQTATHFEVISANSQRWVEIHTYPTPERLWVYSHDVTSRKEAEAERERRLQEAQEANRLKDDFLATVAHELRSPLSAVLGWANLLREGALDEADQVRGIETIERSAQAQARIIDDIFDISRVMAGKMRLESQQVDMECVLKGAINIARPAAEAKGVQLWLELEATVTVTGDPNRLQQVFSNLLSNAVKFTPRNGQVRVALHNLGNEVQVIVADTGQGIAPQFLPLIFERFQQADVTNPRAHDGLGLGLSIVRQLVELHNGRVWADTGDSGKGATFTVSLPCAMMTLQSEESAPNESSALDIIGDDMGSLADAESIVRQSNATRTHRESPSNCGRPVQLMQQSLGVQWSHSLNGTALRPPFSMR